MNYSNQPCNVSHQEDDMNGKVTNREDRLRPPKVRRVEEKDSSPHNVVPEEFVPSDVDPDKIDSMIAKEMVSLSIQEREKALYDIHGIPDPIQETPELIQASLSQLDRELVKLPHASALKQATAMNPKFVEDEKFRLKFLRADLFDPCKAAERMALHFQVKLELFGHDLLTRNITQDDLDQDTLNIIYSGRLTRLKNRDSAGRPVSIRFQQETMVPLMAHLRTTFYLNMLASEDEETQRNGVVIISYMVGQSPDLWKSFHFRREMNLKLPRVIDASPVRYVAIHHCHDLPLAWRIVFAVFKLAANQSSRLRIREHYGDREESLRYLRSFGILTDDFPVDANGNISIDTITQNMKAWRKMERQRFLKDQHELGNPDRATGYRRRVVTPAEYDVLLGRGKAFYQHAGNVTLRHLVEEQGPAYEVANQSQKTKMSADIVASIQQVNGCFLEDDGSGGWVEVSDTAAKRKVAHAFRTLRQQSRITHEPESV